ncbi:hypothetical protein MKW98_006445 [Papaver atlanticum]|uniref:Uncharacterized protein n=1 Tax=Papaver atlanticum TaxID=357466 RepID=A0AAD4SI28_9MAGN|nr:hypothetical protein MKW98_006445 [Papaver atlanticum]
MDSSQDGVRRSPRLIELHDKEKQLWRAFNERRRLAYQNRKTRIDEASTSLDPPNKNEPAMTTKLNLSGPDLYSLQNTSNSSVQFSNSAGGFIPRRSPRFIGCGNTAESLDKGVIDCKRMMEVQGYELSH